MDAAIIKLDKVDLVANNSTTRYRSTKIRLPEELKYAYDLASALKRMGDLVEIRVESPWISVYTNEQKLVNTLVKLDENNVKYVSSPAKGVTLTADTVVMSKRNYEYKITLGITNSEHSAFVTWAESNASKVLLTKKCKRDMLRDRSSGGSYFYLTGDNVLLMAKMHLSTNIAKVERITKK